MSHNRQDSLTSSEEQSGADVNESRQNAVFSPYEGEQQTRGTSPLADGVQRTQKRRRVTRACDECRRKKIKCDGTQPCTHCTVYSYQCTYDQPSNRRRNPVPQHVEALESRLRKAEDLLRNAMPEANLDELLKTESPSDGDLRSRSTMAQESGHNQGANRPEVKIERKEDESDSLLETMVDATGQLDIDDEGYPDFHGQSSGIVFLRKIREQFGDMMGQAEGYGKPFLKRRNLATQNRNPISTDVSFSSMETAAHSGSELPKKECAALLCDIALNDACVLMRFVHQPDFWNKFHHIYSTRQEDYGDAEVRFLPLLYSILALGSLFAKVAQSKLQSMGYEPAIQQGFGWFCVAREMINLTELRDLTALQTVLFMILYLQASSRLSTCYAYIGIVTRCAGLMGLHRLLGADFNPIEQQIRKRVFWTIMKMDIYVGALLGLPMGIDDDERDQDLPFDIDDEYITSEAIHPQPAESLSLMCGCNAHTRLVFVLKKTMRYVYPIKPNQDSSGSGYLVSFAKVREIEEDLEKWKASLPEPLRPGSEASPEFKRSQQLLRMAYAHVQIFLYRPFLHYATVQSQSKHLDKRCYGCAAACVNISRNIIHITTSMKDGGLLNGAYWFYMYTTFFAVLSLVYYILANPKSPDSEDFLQDAIEGKDNLKALAKTSLAADRCTQTLAGLFQELPGRWRSLRTQQGSTKKRSARSSTHHSASRQPQEGSSNQDSKRHSAKISSQSTRLPQRSNWTSPKELLSAQWNHKMTQEPLLSQPGLSIDPTDFGSPSAPTDFSSTTAPKFPSNTTPSILHFQEQVPDFNMMIFPSQDPFAYPNPPVTTLEAHHIHHGGGPYSPSSSSDPNTQQPLSSTLSPSTTTTATTTFENFHPQALGHLPPYLMQAQQPGMMGFQRIDPDANAYPLQDVISGSSAAGGGAPNLMAVLSPGDVRQGWDLPAGGSPMGTTTTTTQERQDLAMGGSVAGRTPQQQQQQQQHWPGGGYGGQ